MKGFKALNIILIISTSLYISCSNDDLKETLSNEQVEEEENNNPTEPYPLGNYGFPDYSSINQSTGTYVSNRESSGRFISEKKRRKKSIFVTGRMKNICCQIKLKLYLILTEMEI